MTPLALFALLATLLVVAVAAYILTPLWRGSRVSASSADRQAANLAIFRDQLAELEREQGEGTLAPADYEQAKAELQRRLLEEVRPEAQATAGSGASRPLAITLMLALPILAVVGYGILGNPRATDPAAVKAQTPMTQEQIEGMVGRLAQRLKENPNDSKGWIMLARSYKALGRVAEAAEAYAKVEKDIADQPDLLVDYAEALAMAGQGDHGSLKGKPTQLVEQALKVDAQHPRALLMAGAAAMERGDKAKAIAYWEQLLPMVEPGSEVESMLRSSIDKLKAK